MISVELIADTNVLSYLFRRSALGFSYARLIGRQSVGVTGLSLAELRSGAVIGHWGDRRLSELVRFLQEFTHVPEAEGMAEVCGALRAHRARVGRPMDWPDAWAAACALWFDIPLVTHDRDLEGIPRLRILTVHDEWRVCEEEISREFTSRGLWLGEGSSRRHTPTY